MVSGDPERLLRAAHEVDELAHAAKVDPVEFRRRHLKPGSRHLKVLDEVAKRSGWGTPLPEGVGRGVAIVESFKTIVAHVIEASVKEDGSPKVLKVTTVVDAGSIVNPDGAGVGLAHRWQHRRQLTCRCARCRGSSRR